MEQQWSVCVCMYVCMYASVCEYKRKRERVKESGGVFFSVSLAQLFPGGGKQQTPTQGWQEECKRSPPTERKMNQRRAAIGAVNFVVSALSTCALFFSPLGLGQKDLCLLTQKQQENHAANPREEGCSRGKLQAARCTLKEKTEQEESEKLQKEKKKKRATETDRRTAGTNPRRRQR